MRKVLLTGAFGNVGRSAISALLEQGDDLYIFETPTHANLRFARKLLSKPRVLLFERKYLSQCSIQFGDIRDYEKIKKAVEGKDAVIHLAAVIPPAANKNPQFARSVNVGGTANILKAIEESGNKAILAFASSVATYGSRLDNPNIRVDDQLCPCDDDEYAKQKVECEAMIRESRVRWTILRLSYIVWKEKLQMDPLMFRMPLRTSIEVCHTEDTGRAFAHAIATPEALGRTFNIGGGEKCRTTYREYLDRMLSLFGLGGIKQMPEAAFSSAGYHCGYMDSAEAERVLHFQRKTLEDYYAEVEQKSRATRFFASLVRPIARAIILSRSPYLKRGKAPAEKKACRI